MMKKKDIQSGISLCMIVKNEAEMIKRTIDSVRPIVNEIIVVDTGSHDRTCERAHALGARVLSFPWQDDFSAARNFSLNQARYAWILVLDADEVIAKRDLGKILHIIQDDTCDAVVFSQRNYCNSPDAEGWSANGDDYDEGKGFTGYFDIPVIRLFRNDRRIYFQGLVHEVVDNTITDMKKRFMSVPIHHYSRYEDQTLRERKSSFYLSLLLKQLERNPNDSQTWFHIGRQYYTIGKYAEAIVFLRKVVASGSQCEMAYDNLGTTYFNCGMFEESRTILEQLLQLNPRYYEAYSTLGAVYYELGDVNKAIDVLKKAIDVYPTAFKPYFNLAATFYREKRYADALPVIQKAACIAPHFPQIFYLMFFILYNLGRWDEAYRCAQQLRERDGSLYRKIEAQCAEIEHTRAVRKGVPHS